MIEDIILSYWCMSPSWYTWVKMTDNVSGVPVVHKENYGIYLRNRLFIPFKLMSKKDKKKHARQQRRLLFDSTLGYPGEGPTDRHTQKFLKRSQKKDRKQKIEANRDSKLNQHRDRKKKAFDSTKGYPGEGPTPAVDEGVAFYQCKTHNCQLAHYHKNRNHANAARRVAAKGQGEGGGGSAPPSTKTEKQPEYKFCDLSDCKVQHYHVKILEQVQPLEPKDETTLFTAGHPREDRDILRISSRGGKDKKMVMLKTRLSVASDSKRVAGRETKNKIDDRPAEAKYPLDSLEPTPQLNAPAPSIPHVETPKASDPEDEETEPPVSAFFPDDEPLMVKLFGPDAGLPRKGKMDVFVYFPDQRPPRGWRNTALFWIYTGIFGAEMYTDDKTLLVETEDSARVAQFNRFWRYLGIQGRQTFKEQAIYDVFGSCGMTRRQKVTIDCQLAHRVMQNPFFLTHPPLTKSNEYSASYMSTLQNAVSTVEGVEMSKWVHASTTVFLFNVAVFHFLTGLGRFVGKVAGEPNFRRGRVDAVGPFTLRPHIV